MLKQLTRLFTILVGSLALASCGINSVPTAEENAKAKWADVQAAFQERANLIPNLQEIVMSSAEQERETLEGVIQARASATRPEIQLSADDLGDASKMQAFQQAQGELSSALSRLMVTVEQYPELRSQENFGRFMTQLEGSENRIRVSIRDYNEAVRQYNTTIRTFPDIIGATIIHGAEEMEPYQAVTEGAEVAPELDMRSE
ncbi:LemA family protein [Alteraurantiacibacter aquimixticola]|uniref:LemA family protein n=1 Tax=Alteraurantiacibacter aquimixticola TaxID=2489173 RepID=A0A4T3F2U4_9SPHN|nr:LemA family protein [Alteraurantiacibacter aquimixticola]TIX51585.1 LemA family protein [Alteraurantiacibacter aquimixticola]